MHQRTNTHTNIHTRTRTHIHTHTHIHTYTHTHTRIKHTLTYTKEPVFLPITEAELFTDGYEDPGHTSLEWLDQIAEEIGVTASGLADPLDDVATVVREIIAHTVDYCKLLAIVIRVRSACGFREREKERERVCVFHVYACVFMRAVYSV
jgi:hypothetical protein